MNNKKGLRHYVSLADEGTKEAVNTIMKDLNRKMTLAQSKFIDYALGLIDTQEGRAQMTYYLFNGTQVQRNYCALYFGRLDEYDIIRRAYDKGLIDARQAFSR